MLIGSNFSGRVFGNVLPFPSAMRWHANLREVYICLSAKWSIIKTWWCPHQMMRSNYKIIKLMIFLASYSIKVVWGLPELPFSSFFLIFFHSFLTHTLPCCFHALFSSLSSLRLDRAGSLGLKGILGSTPPPPPLPPTRCLHFSLSFISGWKRACL